MKKILIIGATSAIAQETAKLFAEAGDRLFLTARSMEKLQAIATDLQVRGADAVHTGQLEVLDYEQHDEVLRSAIATLEGLDLILIAHGTLPDQEACQQSFETTRREFEINALSTISLLTLAANYFEERKTGTIAVISSVAGDRGRQSNYVYGAAKGAVTLFLQGLRNRLHKSGVKVLTIKPGFVDTPMTADFKKGPLWETPQNLAKQIVASLDKQRDIAYLPWFWRYIMLIIKSIPEVVFKRLSL